MLAHKKNKNAKWSTEILGFLFLYGMSAMLTVSCGHTEKELTGSHVKVQEPHPKQERAEKSESMPPPDLIDVENQLAELLGKLAVGMEDSPPPGWTQIDSISNGGVYDPGTHKIKWGPFFSPFPEQVTYDLLPPGQVTANDCFVGAVSFDGIDQSIQGDECLPDPIPAVSEWGLVAMALLTLSAGTIAVSRRRVVA